MAMPRRPSTLEPLSANAMNRRSLLGGPARNGSRPSVGAGFGDTNVVKRPSQGGRLSLFGGAGAPPIAKRPSNGRPSNPMTASVAGVRRSTAYSHVRQDPRPNTDKGYIQASIRALINYLTEHNYDHPFSPKILSRPTARDFTYIISFLFRQVDPHFKMVGKLEEEVIGFFKAIHYPFQISKASLSAVGTMHTWPTLLASITWLIELLTYDEEVQNKQLSEEVGDDREDNRLFYDYLGKAYKAFLDGNDEQESQLDAALVSTFDERDMHVEKQCEAAEARLAKLRAQIQECHDRKATLPALREKHADYVSDLGKFRTHLEQVQSHREAMATKVAKRQAELSEIERQLETVLEETAQLREVVANQELSPEEAQRMIQERERLQEAMLKASKHNQDMKKALWEAEMELSRAVENLQTAVGTFNSKAAELQLIPLSARNSNGIQYEMVVHKHAISETADSQALVGVDVKNTIRPSLMSLKNIVIEGHHKARKEVLRLLDEQARSEEELSEVLQQLSSLENKAKKQEEIYRAEKAALEANMADKSEEVDRVESQVMHLRSQVVGELEAKVAKNHQKIAQLQTDLQIERDNQESDYKSILEAIMNTLTLCADHKEHVKRRLGELKEYYTQKRDMLLGTPEDGSALPV